MFKLSKSDREYYERIRGHYPNRPSWYATMTHCGKERLVGRKMMEDFAGRGLGEILLPEVLEQPRRDQVEPEAGKLLFTSHVFFNGLLDDEIYMKICAYPGVYKILGRTYRIPGVISDEEMMIFKAVLNTSPPPRLVSRQHIGTQVCVTSGLMKGLRGQVIEVQSKFVKIQADFSFVDRGSAIIVAVPHELVCLGQEARESLVIPSNNHRAKPTPIGAHCISPGA